VRVGSRRPSLCQTPVVETCLLTLIATLVLAVSACSANMDHQLSELRGLLDEVSVPRGFQLVDVRERSKFTHAYVSRSYRCERPLDEVQSELTRQLEAKGWTLKSNRSVREWGEDFGGRILVFTRGPYSIQLQYAGAATDYSWDYCLSVEA